MEQVRIESVHSCSVDMFWEIFFDPEYNRRLFKEGLGFPSFEVVSNEETETTIKRVIDVTPKLTGVPGPLRAVVGDGFSYREHGTFDKAKKRYDITIVPSRMSDKLELTGFVEVTAVGDDKCKRVFELSAKAKIFAIGGMLEKKIAEDMRTNYEANIRFTDSFLASRQA